MDTVDQSNKLIMNHLSIMDRQLRDVKKESTMSIKKQKIREFKGEIESIKSELNMFEIELISAPEKQREKFFVNYNNYEGQVSIFEKELKQIENEMANKPSQEIELVDHNTVIRNEPQDLGSMQRDQLIKHVDDKQKGLWMTWMISLTN